MDKGAVQLGQTVNSPILRVPGISLNIPQCTVSLSKKEPLLVHGCCRMNKEKLTGDKKDMLGGLCLTAIELKGQSPTTINVLRRQLLLEDDIVEAGADYVVFFHFDLWQILEMPWVPLSHYIHVTFYQHFSGIFRIDTIP